MTINYKNTTIATTIINLYYMPIFGNNNNEEQPNQMETIIGPSVKVEGNFKGDGNITVEGMVQGSLKTSHNLTIGSQAKIKAEIEAKNLFLSGEVKGNVKVHERAELSKSARLLGNIETKVISVEQGAVLNGKCSMINNDISSDKDDKEQKENSKEGKKTGK